MECTKLRNRLDDPGILLSALAAGKDRIGAFLLHIGFVAENGLGIVRRPTIPDGGITGFQPGCSAACFVDQPLLVAGKAGLVQSLVHRVGKDCSAGVRAHNLICSAVVSVAHVSAAPFSCRAALWL